MQQHSSKGKVSKLHLEDVKQLSGEEITDLVASGMVEIIISGTDGAEWGDAFKRFFDRLEQNQSWREKLRNKTVIINMVDPKDL